MTDFHPTHRHYKGNFYQLLYTATHSETQEEMAVYRGQDGRIWTRPMMMFTQALGDGTPRFAPLPEPRPEPRFESKIHAIRDRRSKTGESLSEAMFWADANPRLWSTPN